jgi:hypothetical protein
MKLEPNVSPLTCAWLERIQALPINAPGRAQARAEFERAEASTGRLLRIVERFSRALSALRRLFVFRGHRQVNID